MSTSGIVTDEPERLLLAPLDRPVDEPTRRLLDGGSLTVPAADLPRLLSAYYPALRQRCTSPAATEAWPCPRCTRRTSR